LNLETQIVTNARERRREEEEEESNKMQMVLIIMLNGFFYFSYLSKFNLLYEIKTKMIL
jgi:hypothetical protein